MKEFFMVLMQFFERKKIYHKIITFLVFKIF